MQAIHTKKQTFLQGALLLTFAGIISKILSAVYRVPYQNIAGDIGFYIYQQVYPFYGIAIALALHGFPVVISKIISEEKGVPKQKEQFTLIYSLLTLFSFGVIFFLVLFFSAASIAKLMGDKHLIQPVKMVSFIFLLLPFISIFRGYFQGYGNMLPTALSQITEQFIRVSSILLLAYFLVKSGFNFYQIGTGAVIGSIIGGVAGLAVLLIFRKSLLRHFTWNNFIEAFKLKHIRAFPFKRVLISSIAISTTGLTLVLLQLVDSFTLYSSLVEEGVDPTSAKLQKGIFDRGQPLIQLGVVLATSLSLSVVPTISMAVRVNDQNRIAKTSRLALKVSVVIGTGATLGLLSIMKYTNFMLFKDMAGSSVLSVFCIIILLLSISLTAAAVLQGLGFITETALIVVAGFIVKVGLNYALVPIYETMGAAIASVIAVLFIAFLMVVLLVRKLKQRKVLSYTPFLKTIMSGLGMMMTIRLYEWAYFDRFSNEVSRINSSIFALSSVFLGGLVFLLLVYVLKIFNKDEIAGWKNMK